MSKQARITHQDGYAHYSLPPGDWFEMYSDVEICTETRQAAMFWTFFCFHLMSQCNYAVKTGELLLNVRRLQSEMSEILCSILGSSDRRDIVRYGLGDYSPPLLLPTDTAKASPFIVDLLKSSIRGLKWFDEAIDGENDGLSSDEVWDWWIGGLTQIFGEGGLNADLPPLKWSSLKYDFRTEDKIDGKEEAYG